MALLDVSKMITDRQRLSEFVDWFMRVYRESLSAAIAKVFHSDLEDSEPPPDFLGVINALIRVLRRSVDNLIESEMALLDELSEDEMSRRIRNGLITTLRRAMADARGLLRHAYGAQMASDVGFPDRIAFRPLALLRQTMRVSRRLRKLGFELGEPLYEGARNVTKEMILSAFEPAADTLRRALDGVTEEKSKTHGAQVAKNTAQTEFDETYAVFVRMLEAAFRLGGQPELAKRFRPTIPQRSSTSEPPTDPDPGNGEPDEPVIDEPAPDDEVDGDEQSDDEADDDASP